LDAGGLSRVFAIWDNLTPMIVHVFNSSVVSGPETLAIPVLPTLGEPVAVVFLSETRVGERARSAPAYSKSFGIETHEITVRSRWDRRAVKDLRTLLEKLSPRVVHAQEVKAAAYVAGAKRGYRGPAALWVTTNHGVRAKKAFMLRFYEWLFTHVIMRSFDRVLAVCTSDRGLLEKQSVPASKLVVHLNGVDRPRVDPSARAAESARIRKQWKLEERGIAPDALVLGLVGRLAPEKRHAYILRSLKRLLERHPELDVHLLVFGIGALAESLHAETRALDLEKRVHWMGYRGTVGAENAGFDLLVSLSFAEGLPINVIEAGWAATPVFATAIDGNLDLVPSPEYGALIPVEASESQVAEHLSVVLKNRRRLDEMGRRFQERVVAHFSGRAWRDKLLEIYAARSPDALTETATASRFRID
jgi:glycosyltransferase involved in cell wall biosynthesis